MKDTRSNEWKNKIYQNWRNAVFERDGYKCLTCGRTEKLHAHHIEPYMRCVEKRYDVNNGQTLCASCHARLEHLGKKHSLETRIKRSLSLKGRIHSYATRKKISETRVLRKISPSQEVRERISKKLMGNISWNTGKKLTEEHKQALRGKRPHVKAWNRGLPLTDEVKRKLSEVRKGRPSPRKGAKLSQESIDKMKETKRRKFLEKKALNGSNKLERNKFLQSCKVGCLDCCW